MAVVLREWKDQMGLTTFIKVLPFVFVTEVSLTTDIPDAVVPMPPVAMTPDAVHETRKNFLVRTFRKIFQLENPHIDLGNGTSREAAEHLLPYGVLLNKEDPCATDVTDRQMELFGRVAGYDSFHWAWFPEDETRRSTGYRMYVITKMNAGDLASYLEDAEFISAVAGEVSPGVAGYDGYLHKRDVKLDHTECAGFDLYQIELS